MMSVIVFNLRVGVSSQPAMMFALMLVEVVVGAVGVVAAEVVKELKPG